MIEENYDYATRFHGHTDSSFSPEAYSCTPPMIPLPSKSAVRPTAFRSQALGQVRPTLLGVPSVEVEIVH